MNFIPKNDDPSFMLPDGTALQYQETGHGRVYYKNYPHYDHPQTLIIWNTSLVGIDTVLAVFVQEYKLLYEEEYRRTTC